MASPLPSRTCAVRLPFRLVRIEIFAAARSCTPNFATVFLPALSQGSTQSRPLVAGGVTPLLPKTKVCSLHPRNRRRLLTRPLERAAVRHPLRGVENIAKMSALQVGTEGLFKSLKDSKRPKGP